MLDSVEAVAKDAVEAVVEDDVEAWGLVLDIDSFLAFRDLILSRFSVFLFNRLGTTRMSCTLLSKGLNSY